MFRRLMRWLTRDLEAEVVILNGSIRRLELTNELLGDLLNKLFLGERFKGISRIPKCQVGMVQYLKGTDGKWYKSWEYPCGIEGKDDWHKKVSEEPVDD